MLEEQRLQQGHIYLASFPYVCAQLEEDCQASSMATFFCNVSWGILVHVKKFFLRIWMLLRTFIVHIASTSLNLIAASPILECEGGNTLA